MKPFVVVRYAGALLLLFALGLGLAYRFVATAPAIVRLPVVEDCYLHRQPCSVALPRGGTLTFEISPRSPRATDALELRAEFDQLVPAAVGASFKGVNMDMGHLEYLVHELSPQQTNGENASYRGSGGVFACSLGVMQWLVLVRVQLDESIYEIPFRFETVSQNG